MTLIRRESNGVLWIDRPDPRVEAQLDAEAIRLLPSELQWVERVEPMPRDVGELEGAFRGRRAVLLGKGPSLDSWVESAPARGEALWIALNEAANVLPETPDYDFVMDAPVLENLRIDRAPVLVTSPLMLPACSRWEGGRWFWRWTRMGRRYNTAASALATLGLWGVTSIRMIGFDAHPNGSVRTVLPNPTVYAPGVLRSGVRDRGSTDFSFINSQIDEVAAAFGLALEW